MPYATKKRANSKRPDSGSRKRATYKQPVVNGISSINGRPSLGSTKDVSFIYYEPNRFLTSVSGVCVSHNFTPNSLFDPDRTSAGHQPVNFDQLMSIFETYCVYECEYKVTFRLTTSDISCIVGVNISDDPTSTGVLTSEQYVENGQTQWGIVDTQSAGNSIKTFTGKMDIAKIMGCSRQSLLIDERYKGLATASPPDQVILNCFLESQSAALTSAVVIACELRFKARLEGSKINALS